MCEGAQVRQRAQDHRQHESQVVVPEDRQLFERRVERLVVLEEAEEILDEQPVVGERPFAAGHVFLVEIAFDQLVVERADQVGLLRPSQLAGCEAVVHRVAVGKHAQDRIVHEFGVRVEVLVGRQLLLAVQLDAALGVADDFGGQRQHLEIEVYALSMDASKFFSDVIMLSDSDFMCA